MIQTAPSLPAGGLSQGLRVARVGVRVTRRSLRHARHPHRWWNVVLRSDEGIELRPATVHAAEPWQRMVTATGGRPPGDGVAASSLGSAPDARQWRQQCLDLRMRARVGLAYPYLVHLDGRLIGETLGFLDLGSSSIEVVPWLRARDRTPRRTATCLDLVTQHVFAAPESAHRALCYLPAEEAGPVCSASGLGFRPEGLLADPPRPDRALVVARRTGRERTSTP